MKYLLVHSVVVEGGSSASDYLVMLGYHVMLEMLAVVMLVVMRYCWVVMVVTYVVMVMVSWMLYSTSWSGHVQG